MVVYLVFLIYYDRFDIFAWIFGLLLLWYLVYKFVVPLLAQRGVSGYVRKYSTHEQVRQTRGTLFRIMLRTFGPTPGIILVYFFIAVILSVTFGWRLAAERVLLCGSRVARTRGAAYLRGLDCPGAAGPADATDPP